MKIYKIEILVDGEWIHRPWYGEVVGTNIEKKLAELEQDHQGALSGFQAIRFIEIQWWGASKTDVTISEQEYLHARFNTALNSLYCAGVLMPRMGMKPPDAFPSAATWAREATKNEELALDPLFNPATAFSHCDIAK